MTDELFLSKLSLLQVELLSEVTLTHTALELILLQKLSDHTYEKCVTHTWNIWRTQSLYSRKEITKYTPYMITLFL